MESLFGVVGSAVSNFSLVHCVLSTSVPLDDAHNDEDKQEKGNCQHHADEPASCSHCVLGLNNGAWNIIKILLVVLS
jgi:hypothetical protein